jgi:hypothetical protein
VTAALQHVIVEIQTARNVHVLAKEKPMVPKSSVRFSPYAWAKLQALRDFGETEVSGFGITDPEDPLCVHDIVLVKQTATQVGVVLDDASVADFFDDCIDEGLHPENFGRVWIHTHPSGIHHPSLTDEQTFAKCLGNCDWAVMFILSKDDVTYCGLQYNKRPAHRVELKNTYVDFSIPFYGSDIVSWKKEYDSNVTKQVINVSVRKPDSKDHIVPQNGARPYSPLDGDHFVPQNGARAYSFDDDDFSMWDFTEDEFYKMMG